MFNSPINPESQIQDKNSSEDLSIYPRWISNDKLKLVKITNSSNNFVEYCESGNINKIKSDEFLTNFKAVDLDTTLYNGIPLSYLGDYPIWF